MSNAIKKVQEYAGLTKEVSIAKEQLAKKLKEKNINITSEIEIYSIVSKNLNEQAYYIIDNNSNFGGKIILKKSIWTYFSFKTPITCWYTKTMAVVNILMLRELANLSGLNDINWFIVCGSCSSPL